MVLLETPRSWLAPWPTAGLPGDPRGTPRVRARSQQPAGSLCQVVPRLTPARWRGCYCRCCFWCRYSQGFSLKGREFDFGLVFTLLPCLYKQFLLVKRHLVWEEPMQTSSVIVVKQKVLYLIWLWQMDWPKPDLSALGSADALLNCRGCRLVFMYCERMSFWQLSEKGGKKRQIQFYSIHNFNNKNLLYTALRFTLLLTPPPTRKWLFKRNLNTMHLRLLFNLWLLRW